MFVDETFLKQFFGITVAILLVGYVYFIWSYQYWRKRNVPYLEPTVPIGNFGSMLGDIVSVFYDKAKANGEYINLTKTNLNLKEKFLILVVTTS